MGAVAAGPDRVRFSGFGGQQQRRNSVELLRGIEVVERATASPAVGDDDTMEAPPQPSGRWARLVGRHGDGAEEQRDGGRTPDTGKRQDQRRR
jgi:hypothetical protein